MPFEFRPIAYGLATFVGGWFLMGSATPFLIGKFGAENPSVWELIKFGFVAISAVAAFVSAFYSKSRRIVQGTIGGTVGVLLPIAIGAAFIPSYPGWGVPVIVASFTGSALLGAVGGNYVRSRRGP
jgi:hypothetical protein